MQYESKSRGVELHALFGRTIRRRENPKTGGGVLSSELPSENHNKRPRTTSSGSRKNLNRNVHSLGSLKEKGPVEGKVQGKRETGGREGEMIQGGTGPWK